MHDENLDELKHTIRISGDVLRHPDREQFRQSVHETLERLEKTLMVDWDKLHEKDTL